MTAARSIPLSEYPARRIALVKPSALGDIVHSLPVLTALRRRYPHAYITWVVNRSYEPLLAGHPDLDATLPFDRTAVRADPVDAVLTYLQFFRRLRAQRFDLVIDLQGLLRSGLMSLASAAPRRVGLAGAREGARHCYTDVIAVPEPRSTHAVDRYFLVAQAFGASAEALEFRVAVPQEARRWAADVLSGCPRPWLMLGVGARWLTKRWPPEHFAEVAQRVQGRFGGTAVFVGRPDEAALTRAVVARLNGPVRNLVGVTTLPQLAAVLSVADVMLANDTGPTHLAAALGRPVVAPYTCTQVRLHGPYRTPGGTVETRVGCAGSYRKRCASLECMTELSPERLWPVLEEVLLKWQSSCRSA